MIDTPQLVDETERTTAVIRGTAVSMNAIGGFFDSAFRTLGPAIAAQEVHPVSAAFALYRTVPTEVVDLEVGFVVDRPVTATGELVPSTLPGGRLARAIHHGGFDGLGDSWGQLREWIAEQGLTAGQAFWEVYLVQPTPTMDPAELRTELDVPVS